MKAKMQVLEQGCVECICFIGIAICNGPSRKVLRHMHTFIGLTQSHCLMRGLEHGW